VIISGEAQVLGAVESQEGEFKSLGIITEGELLGEMSLFERQQRSASVIASTELRLLKIEISDFEKFLGENPKIASTVLVELLVVLSRRLRETSREQVTLFEAGKVIASYSSEDDLLQKSFSIILSAVPASEAGILVLYNKFNNLFEVKASSGLLHAESVLNLKSEPLTELLLATGKSFEGDPSSDKELCKGQFSGAQSVIASPIMSGESFLGFLALFSYKYTSAFTPAQRNLLGGICSLLAPALENAAYRREESNRLRLRQRRV